MEHLPDYASENENKTEIEELMAKKALLVKACDELSEKIINKQEVFQFSGIEPDAYKRLKEDEAGWAEINGDIPDDALPVDGLLEEFAEHGIKVVLAIDRTGGNVFVVSAKKDSKVVWENNLFPWQLRIVDGMNEDLKNLIKMSQELHDIKLLITGKRIR